MVIMQTQPPPSHAPSPIYNLQATIEGGFRILEQTPTQSTTKVLLLNVVQNFTQLCLGGVIISALFLTDLSDVASRIYSQHIVLCTVGYLILMTQAILSFSPVGWANNLKYEKQKIVHGSMQVLGSILATSGSCILLADGKFSLDSVHGQCSFVAMILTIVNLIAGALNFLFHQETNKLVLLHLSLGTAEVTVAFIALILAFHAYYRDVVRDGYANLSIIITVFALVGTVLMATVNFFERIRVK